MYPRKLLSHKKRKEQNRINLKGGSRIIDRRGMNLRAKPPVVKNTFPSANLGATSLDSGPETKMNMLKDVFGHG